MSAAEVLLHRPVDAEITLCRGNVPPVRADGLGAPISDARLCQTLPSPLSTAAEWTGSHERVADSVVPLRRRRPPLGVASSISS